MDKLDDEMVAVMQKRVYDIAGCNSSLKVSLNGKVIAMKSFAAYCELFVPPTSSLAEFSLTDKQGLKRWEIAVTASDNDFRQVSFVNSICTLRGGTHVDHLCKKITDVLIPFIEKKNNGKGKISDTIKPQFIKANMVVFVNSLINNPEFDGQSKEFLKSKVATFGSQLNLPEDFLKKIQSKKIGIVENVLNYAAFKGNKKVENQLKGKKTKKITGYDKLVDASNAGTRNAHLCTLILTEGDSAKALAVAGMSVVGHENYGVFPLKGKLLNVKSAGAKALASNVELQAITKIMGLKAGHVYKDLKELRYGHLMIMSDQDTDGSHIKGLVLNFIHQFWPSLLEIQGFCLQFITPIVKATKGKKVKSFFSVPEFEEWRETPEARGYSFKYYKGLGTSTSQEAREYFSNLKLHKKTFTYDGKNDATALALAFAKDTAKKAKGDVAAVASSADERKDWINAYNSGTYLDQTKEKVSITDFVHKELVLYGIASNQRAIPSAIDGLKTGHRKIIFSCFKRNLVKEIRVAQLSGYVSEKAAYHHGEASLQTTIVKMAQNFVGSNNINLLHPQGQFGTRLENGDDSASARYIHTFLTPLARAIFHKDDDPILNYLVDDGLSIEPDRYVPVIPLLLVNGAAGIGTGWSSTIPNFNPRDIVANLRRLMNGEEQEVIHPWYRGYKGDILLIEDKERNRYSCHGLWERKGDDSLEITELPIGYSPAAFKIDLEKLIEKEPNFLTDYSDFCTDTKISIILNFPTLSQMTDEDIQKKFGLVTFLKLSNMWAYDKDDKLVKYNTPQDIIKAFYDVRLEYYQKRKDYLVNAIESDFRKLENKVRFIMAVIKKELNVSNKAKKELLSDLMKGKYDKFPKKEKKKKDFDEELVIGDVEAEDEDTAGYDYLLSMKIWSLTKERVEALKRELEEKKRELEALQEKTPIDLWNTDLDNFLEAWDTFEQEMEKFDEAGGAKTPKKGNRPKFTALSAKPKATKAKATKSDDGEDKPVKAARGPKKAAAGGEKAKPGPKPKGGAAAEKGAAKPKQLKRKLVDDDTDDDVEIDTPPPKAKQAKITSFTTKTATKKKAHSDDDGSESSSDDFEMQVDKKSKIAPKHSFEFGDSDSDMITPEKAKPAAKTAAKPATAKTAAKPATKAAPKKSTILDDSSESEEKAKSPKKAAKPAVTKVATKVATKTVAAKTAPKKKSKKDSDSDESEESSTSEPALSFADRAKQASKGQPIAVARAGRNRAPVKYQDEPSSSDGSSSDDSARFGSESESASESDSSF